METIITELIDKITSVMGSMGFISGFLLIILESMIPILPLAVFIALNIMTFGSLFGFLISWIATVIGCMISFTLCRKLRDKFSDNQLKDFKIVGIVDTEAESIFVNNSMFVNIIANATGANNVNDWFSSVYKEETTDSEVMDYNLFLDDITITKGRLPENDYEVIVNQINKDTMKLNKTIKAQVNGEELVVVGYYDSQTDLQAYLVNNNTVKYNVINKQNSMTIYAKDKSQVMNKFRDEYRLTIIDRYEKDRSDYLEYKKDSVKSAIILASIILAISLVEIYLMMRASFLSRIKEIGVFRAIGVKKSDIYRMFLGEIIAITIFGSVPGIALMTYILASITKIQSASRLFIVNFQTIGLSVLIIFGVNILVGLLPLFKILRKRPARILARHDVE